jgi:hypothetical protein
VDIRTEAAQFLCWRIHKSDFLCSALIREGLLRRNIPKKGEREELNILKEGK